MSICISHDMTWHDMAWCYDSRCVSSVFGSDGLCLMCVCVDSVMVDACE